MKKTICFMLLIVLIELVFVNVCLAGTEEKIGKNISQEYC